MVSALVGIEVLLAAGAPSELMIERWLEFASAIKARSEFRHRQSDPAGLLEFSRFGRLNSEDGRVGAIEDIRQVDGRSKGRVSGTPATPWNFWNFDRHTALRCVFELCDRKDNGQRRRRPERRRDGLQCL